MLWRLCGGKRSSARRREALLRGLFSGGSEAQAIARREVVRYEVSSLRGRLLGVRLLSLVLFGPVKAGVGFLE
jgi:hypothetical protein